MTNTYQTRPVAAGAYRSTKSLKAALTHLVDAAYDATAALCGRAVNILDDSTQATTERPTCPVCARKWDRYLAGVVCTQCGRQGHDSGHCPTHLGQVE
jgi:hypothetical protein